MANRHYLGTSVAFPLRPNGRGGIALAVGIASVEDSIKAIIASAKGSHQMEPFLGVPSFVFKPIPDVAAIGALMRDAIVYGEDRVDSDSIRVDAFINDEGELQINVTYAIKGEATERTLQYGFRKLP